MSDGRHVALHYSESRPPYTDEGYYPEAHYCRTIHNWPVFLDQTSFHCLHFGIMRDEVIGEWRKLRNEKLNDLYASPSIGG